MSALESSVRSDRPIARHVECIVNDVITKMRRGDSLLEIKNSLSGPQSVDCIPAFERVNVTLRCDGKIRGSMSAGGSTLTEQIGNAVIRAAGDMRFKNPITRSELDHTSVEVWIQIDATPLSVSERENGNNIQLGADGLEIVLDGQGAYYKPSVAITSGFTSSKKLLDALCRKAKLPKDAWRDHRTVVKKTQWITILISKEHAPLHLSYLRRKVLGTITKDDINDWVSESCAYFRNHQSWTGSLSYIYNPVRNEILPEQLNIVRASGCLYSLARAVNSAHILNDDAHDTAIRLARFLNTKTRMWRDNCRVLAADESERCPKTGATALLRAALGMSFLGREFDDLETGVTNSIFQSQKPDGRFFTHFGKSEESPAHVEFFPGQILVALVPDVERGCVEAIRMCGDAFEPYRKHFEFAPTTAFIGWQIDAWARLSLARDRGDWASFAYQQADWLLEKQCVDTSVVAYGGFAREGQLPAYSSIVYVEALISALRLATIRGDKEKAGLYKKAVQIGLAFCQKLQLRNIPKCFFPSKHKCFGGIALRLNNLNVRCDVVQHFLTMSLSAYSMYEVIYD